jgi:small-conductance mechanosensitive channel
MILFEWRVLITILVTLGTGCLLWFLNVYFLNQEKKRLNRVKKIDSFDPIEVPDEVGDDIEDVRRKVQSGVARRFSVIRRTILFVVLSIGAIFAALPMLDMASAGTLSTIAGIFSVVLGIAARPVLENFISGIVLSLSNKLKVGDTIYIDGELGTVEDVTVSHTTIKVWNWQRYILPNSMMLNKAIRNCTHSEGLLWTHIEFQASYQETHESLAEMLSEKVKASSYFSGEGEPELWPIHLDGEGVKYWLAAWADGPDAAWYLRNDMRKAVLSVFQKKGVRSHLHLHRMEADGDQNISQIPRVKSN